MAPGVFQEGAQLHLLLSVGAQRVLNKVSQGHRGVQFVQRRLASPQWSQIPKMVLIISSEKRLTECMYRKIGWIQALFYSYCTLWSMRVPDSTLLNYTGIWKAMHQSWSVNILRILLCVLLLFQIQYLLHLYALFSSHDKSTETSYRSSIRLLTNISNTVRVFSVTVHLALQTRRKMMAHEMLSTRALM